MFHRIEALHRLFILKVNPIIRFLTISDVIIIGANQLMVPIFAIFVIQYIEGGNAAVAGAAASIYLITKSLMQIPSASLLDRHKGERDDFLVLFVGTLLVAILPLSYLVISTPGELYVIHFLLGILNGMIYPPYMAMFTRHIDRRREATEWGLRFTLTDLVGAAGSAIGGIIAVTSGFYTLIMILAGINVCGALMLIPIRRYLK